MSDQETPKFTLDDVRSYLENSGALLEAEVLLAGYDKSPANFDTSTPFTKREDSTLGMRLAVALGENENPADFGAVRDLKELEEFENRLRQENKDKESRKKLMDLHLKRFKKEHLQKLAQASNVTELDRLKDDMLAASSPKKVVAPPADFEEVEEEDFPISAEEEQQKKMMELVERHARETAKNKIYEESSQQQLVAVERGKFQAAVELRTGENAEVNVDKDPEILAQIRRVEMLKASRLTANTLDSMDKARFSAAPKPSILGDQSSSSDFLDKWLRGDVSLPKSGFEDVLNSRQEVPVDSTLAQAGEPSRFKGRLETSSSRDSIAGASEVDFSPNSPLMALLNELRSEVKTLKQNVEESRAKGPYQNHISPPIQNQQMFPQQQMPYPYQNPYLPPMYPPVYGFPSQYQQPVQMAPSPTEIDRLNKIAEDLERENRKFNAKSADDLPPSSDQHTRTYSRRELKHQEELREIQNEIQLVKSRRELEELKMEIDSEKVSRAKEIEHAQFLLDHKQKLQALKLKQALIKEQRLLDLHAGLNMSGSDDGEGDLANIRIASGVGPNAIPMELCNGAEIFIDGISVPSDQWSDIDSFRIAAGLYDRKGKAINRLRASDWEDAHGKAPIGTTNVVAYLSEPLRRRVEVEEGLSLYPKLLVELQIQSKSSLQKSIGWGIINLTSFKEYNEASTSLENGLWRVPLRDGVSDPKAEADPLIAKTANSFVLLRITDVNDSAIAAGWSPKSHGLNSEQDLNEAYLIQGAPSIQQREEPEVDRPQSQPFENPKEYAFENPKPSVRAASASRPIVGRPPTGLFLLPEEKAEDLDAEAQPTGRRSRQSTARKRDKSEFWLQGNPLFNATDRYEQGDGVDVYIDGAMFLPDNCTVSRVVVKVLNPDRETISAVYEAYSNPTSSAISPSYNLKVELREKAFNQASTVLVRLDSLDCSTMNSSAVGYVVFKLFCNKDRVQCTQPKVADSYIASGLMQLPIYPQRVPTDKPFSENVFKDLVRIPCASLLVRVYPAPKSADGLTVLNREDFPQADWVKLRLDIPASLYSSGSYDGSACQPSAIEKTSFNAKAATSGFSNTAEASLSQAIAVFGDRVTYPKCPTTSDIEVIKKWMQSVMLPATDMRSNIDYSFCTPYTHDTGLTVCVKMLYNMPSGGLFGPKGIVYKVIYSISPPGLFYKDPPLTEGTHFTVNDDFDQPMACPSWTDDPCVLTPGALEEAQCLILDIRTLRLEKPRDIKMDPKVVIEPPSTRKSFWAILPLAKEKLIGLGYNYVQTGNFQLPLIEGPVPTDILSSSNPYREVVSRLSSTSKGNSLKIVAGASVLVCVKNPLLSGLLDRDIVDWRTSLNTKILERLVQASSSKLDQFDFNMKKFVGTKSTASQLPVVDDKRKIIKVVNKKFAESTGISE